MLFTWSTQNLCIVFRSWRITGSLSLLFSLLAIVALTAGYEAVRDAARRYDAAVASRSVARKSPPSPFPGTVGGSGAEPLPQQWPMMMMAIGNAAHCLGQGARRCVETRGRRRLLRGCFMARRCFIRFLSCECRVGCFYPRWT